jgi:hypothetical protein
MAVRMDPKTGRPYGVSKNTWESGKYTIVGDRLVFNDAAGKKPKEPSQRIFSSDPNNADFQRRLAADMEKQQIQAAADNARQALLKEAIDNQNKYAVERQQARANGMPIEADFRSTAAYQDNRQANYDNMAKEKTDMAAFNERQAAAEQKRYEDNVMQQLAEREAGSRITGADSDLTRSNLTDDRARALKKLNPARPNEDTASYNARINDLVAAMPWEALTPTYLKSIGMVSESDPNSLYGYGSSNFGYTKDDYVNASKDGTAMPAQDISKGFAITDADRKALVQFREDLAAGKYDADIAAGKFSLSGTGLEGMDGKTVAPSNFVYQNPGQGDQYATAAQKTAANQTAASFSNASVPAGVTSNALPQAPAALTAPLDVYSTPNINNTGYNEPASANNGVAGGNSAKVQSTGAAYKEEKIDTTKKKAVAA